jgi:hypothetical protein
VTEQTARKVADVVLVAAAVGATYVILRTPALRRLAIGLAASALTGAVPAWFTREVQRAWAESGSMRREV